MILEGGVAAHKVLPADAANLVSMQVAPAKEGERDADDRCGPVHRNRAENGPAVFGWQRGLPAGFAWRKRRDRMKTEREKAEERRQAKLEEIREQVASGTLVIRAMTPEERRQNPPRPVERRRSGRR